MWDKAGPLLQEGLQRARQTVRGVTLRISTRADTPEPEKIKPPAANRTTLTLHHEELLRGCRPWVLLSGFGARLRETAGGIGSIGKSDDEYSKSFQVDELDIFLSHSWHAPWIDKYLVLLFHFNLKPALFAALLGASSIFLYQRGMAFRWQTEDDFSEEVVHCSTYERRYDEQAPCLSLVCGFVGFIVALLGWHYVSVKFRLDKSIFLDKVCIHQTDSILKEAGIKSIGAILGKSRMVLVAWDPSYFTRLWCTYELSAYQIARPNGRFMVLPVELGVFTPAATFISVACVAARYFVHHSVPVEIVSACAFVPLLLLMSRIRNYLNSLEALQNQLETFSVKKSRCFCCDHNHLHPDTGKRMNCDRELVYESIAHWHGKEEDRENRLEYGLRRFDLLVRANLKKDMERTLGKYAQVPFPHALMISMPPFLQTVDWHVDCPLWWAILASTAQWLLRYPLCIAMILFIISLFRTKRKWALTEAVIEVSLAFVSVGILAFCTILGDYCVYTEGWLPKAALWSCEATVVFILYHRRDSVAVEGFKWALHGVQEGATTAADWVNTAGALVGESVSALRPQQTTSNEFNSTGTGYVGRFWKTLGVARGSMTDRDSVGNVEMAAYETGTFNLCKSARSAKGNSIVESAASEGAAKDLAAEFSRCSIGIEAERSALEQARLTGSFHTSVTNASAGNESPEQAATAAPATAAAATYTAGASQESVAAASAAPVPLAASPCPAADASPLHRTLGPVGLDFSSAAGTAAPAVTPAAASMQAHVSMQVSGTASEEDAKERVAAAIAAPLPPAALDLDTLESY